uniref:Xylulose kinase-1 n=1 Tax=Tanacetum cinerariifolium TaxID=118510 RepID=A0A699KKI1_TANCI|nr:hypothetical protein [Tanacetum cinerariifolium]
MMVNLAFCDYHNMVAILEKTEHNTDFHQIVDFLEASHIRYALTISPTIYVSHIRQFWSTARIETTDQETKITATVDDEPVSLSRDDRHEEAFPTISSLDVGQDRENISKTFAMSYESSPRVPSLDADEGRGIIDIGQELGAYKSTEKGSNDTEEMVNVLSSMEAVNILSSGGAAFSTGSVSPADVFPTIGVPTVSGSFPTPMRIPIINAKDKGKEKVTETKVPKKKKLQEQIDAWVAREMEEEFARENQRLIEHATRDYEIARIHAEEELKLMIEGLDRSNKVIAKHLSEYEQAEADLSDGEKIELISELVKYQDYLVEILKYQA